MSLKKMLLRISAFGSIHADEEDSLGWVAQAAGLVVGDLLMYALYFALLGGLMLFGLLGAVVLAMHTADGYTPHWLTSGLVRSFKLVGLPMLLGGLPLLLWHLREVGLGWRMNRRLRRSSRFASQ